MNEAITTEISKAYTQYLTASVKRGKIFSLTEVEYAKLIFGSCYYCGQLPNQKFRSTKKLKNGIDRKNNSIGYTSENSVSCYKQYNMAKWNNSDSEFLLNIEKIYLHMVALNNVS